MLPLLGDIKRFWSECTCVSDISKTARVDNVIWFYGKYLPVEIKLSASSEKDLPGQCRKYCHLHTMDLDWTVEGSECYEDHVLVIDTDCIYLYTYADHLVRPLKMLDDFKVPADIKSFREELSRLLPIGEVKKRRRRIASEGREEVRRREVVEERLEAGRRPDRRSGRRPDVPALIGFWREKDPLGCCSNWYPAGFDFCGTHFATGEHWMMWQKACLMGDWEKSSQILSAPTPRRAKELGGEVRPYNGALWDAVREQLVYYGVREKFLANGRERSLLLSTGSALLAEASPYDTIWGVGMTADDPRFENPAKWEGENLLGRACMRARADIRQLVALGKLDAVRREWPALDPSIARMTLLQLSRIPATRAAVYCYATIVSHAAPHVYPSAGAYLKKEHDVTVEGVAQSMQLNMGGGLPSAGWQELVRELEIQHALGRL